MRFNPGLRTQLLLGLVLIIIVATVSVGAITVGATRGQLTELERDHARLVGRALARVVGPAAAGGAGAATLHGTLQGVVTGTTVRSATFVDAGLRSVAHAGSSPRPDAQAAEERRRAIRTGQQLLLDEPDHGLRVITPALHGGRVVGALDLELSHVPGTMRWPALFWVLMAVDGLLMVLFVGFVVTRYVVRPVVQMQRAAARVASGDLGVELAEDGAPELSSLAASFNTMTTSVQQQLERLERQQRQLEASRQQVIRSEKLASVGRLAAGVAHEVGNPLQSIIGLTEVQLAGGIDAEQQRDFHGRVLQETQRIHGIIRDLLDYARTVEDDVEPVALGAVVEQAWQLLAPQRRLREVALEARQLEGLPPVAANTRRLVQVMVNLLLNAADAMDGRGEVTIDGAVEEDEVALSVANSGPPVPDEHREQIFDPFFSTKEPGRGTGLGLSVARAIVESHDGRLELAPGDRPRFVITLQRWPDGDAPGRD